MTITRSCFIGVSWERTHIHLNTTEVHLPHLGSTNNSYNEMMRSGRTNISYKTKLNSGTGFGREDTIMTTETGRSQRGQEGVCSHGGVMNLSHTCRLCCRGGDNDADRRVRRGCKGTLEQMSSEAVWLIYGEFPLHLSAGGLLSRRAKYSSLWSTKQWTSNRGGLD